MWRAGLLDTRGHDERLVFTLCSFFTAADVEEEHRKMWPIRADSPPLCSVLICFINSSLRHTEIARNEQSSHQSQGRFILPSTRRWCKPLHGAI